MYDLNEYIGFRVIPIWKMHGDFVGDRSLAKQMFKTFEAALVAMKEDGTCLRETNWEVYGYSSGYRQSRILLSYLYNCGYFDSRYVIDNHGLCYLHKDRQLPEQNLINTEKN